MVSARVKSAGLLAAAISYANRGWHVFPAHSITASECTCGEPDCTSPAKHPCIKGWNKCATTKTNIIERWLNRWPNGNIGIRCGSGLLVLDVDCRDGKDGCAALSELCDRHCWKPETFTVKTGGGGWHYYFQTPLGLRITRGVNVLGSGLDIRAEGGFVVAPPSLHACGVRYQIMKDVRTVPLPGPILELLTEPRRHKQDDGGPVYEGQRHKFLFRLACSMRGKEANEAQILAAVIEANQTRCIPPVSLAEVKRLAKDVVLRYTPGHGNGRPIMDNLYASGVMATLKPSSALVFHCIYEQAAKDSHGLVKLTYKDIGLRTGLGTQAINDAVWRLVGIGLLEKRRTYNATAGWRGTNIYRVTPGSKRFLEYLSECFSQAVSSTVNVRGTTRLTSAAIGEVLNRAYDVVN